MEIWGGVVLEIRFMVMNVSRPLLSVGELQRQGWDVTFSYHSQLRKGGQTIPLARRGGLSYLPARLLGPAPWQKAICDLEQAQQATASAAQSQYAPSNQTLQPQVQAQNQFVQQNPQLINNGTATASPVSHAVDQSLNAVVSQQPQAATIPASAQVGRNQVDISSHFSRCLNSLIRPAILPLASATAASAPVAVAAGSDCPIGSRRRWSQRPIIGNQPDADPSSTATKPSAKRNGIPPASSRHSGHPGPGFQPTSGARNQCNSTKGPSECPSSFAAALPRPTRRIEKRE